MTSVNDFPWNDEQVADLKRLRADGKSATEIAAHMKKAYGRDPGRSSVIGKTHRLGLPLPPNDGGASRIAKASPPAKRRVRTLVVKPKPKPVPLGPDVSQLDKPYSERAWPNMAKDYTGEGVVFSDLRLGRCPWPIDAALEPGTSAMLVCGEPIADHHYCALHNKRAMNPYYHGHKLKTPKPPPEFAHPLAWSS